MEVKGLAEEYNLEISTPGVERELKSPEDYRRFSGELVSLKYVDEQSGEMPESAGNSRRTIRNGIFRILEIKDNDILLENCNKISVKKTKAHNRGIRQTVSDPGGEGSKGKKKKSAGGIENDDGMVTLLLKYEQILKGNLFFDF